VTLKAQKQIASKTTERNKSEAKAKETCIMYKILPIRLIVVFSLLLVVVCCFLLIVLYCLLLEGCQKITKKLVFLRK
jgi:hypothetical protein